jgi:hypothetical protein
VARRSAGRGHARGQFRQGAGALDGGRIRATEHRVLGAEQTRCSIPFFYEPRVDARIARLPGLPGPAFAPFLYGDHLWSLMTAFVEFRGLDELRPPRDPGFRAAG